MEVLTTMIRPYYGCILNTAHVYRNRRRHQFVSGHTARAAWYDAWHIYRTLKNAGFAPIPQVCLVAQHRDWQRTVWMGD